MNSKKTLQPYKQTLTRDVAVTVGFALASLLLAVSSAFAGPTVAPTTQPAVDAVARIGLTVSDADAESRFLIDVLEFRKVEEHEAAGRRFEHLTGTSGVRQRIVTLLLGDEQIELTEFLSPRGRPIPTDSHSNDRWFQHIAIITSDMDRAYARLREHKVRHASSAPQRLPDWNPNAAGIKAFYFHDPDGHVLEILQFPRGKGEPRWQAHDRLFLGIDHTAIVVADTDASLKFYRDTLGLRVTGTSENWGDEQEHLNNVFGAHLRITTLRAPSGPGVELLEYLAPTDGRPYPADEKPNDILHWQTILRGTTVATDTTLLRDPDGHAVEISAP